MLPRRTFKESSKVDQTLGELASRIPSQGGVAIGSFLQKAAAEAPAGTAIVEVGTWLGAGTAQLALGLEGRTDPPALHTYDYFVAAPVHVEKAAAFGLEVREGQDTLPIVKNYLSPFKCEVVYHRGNLQEQTWKLPSISVYVDDAAKTPKTFYHVMKTFGPHWIPGITIVVLMDYTFWRKVEKTEPAEAEKFKVQMNFIEGHSDCFAPIEDRITEGTSTRLFKYVKRLDFDSLKPFEKPQSLIDRLPWKTQVSLRRLRGAARGHLGRVG
jgi:hypothetical protein